MCIFQTVFLPVFPIDNRNPPGRWVTQLTSHVFGRWESEVQRLKNLLKARRLAGVTVAAETGDRILLFFLLPPQL